MIPILRVRALVTPPASAAGSAQHDADDENDLDWLRRVAIPLRDKRRPEHLASMPELCTGRAVVAM